MNKVNTIVEISEEIINFIEKTGSTYNMLNHINLYGWKVRDNYLFYRDLPKFIKKAKNTYYNFDLSCNIVISNEKIIGYLSVHLLDLLKRDRTIKSSFSDTDLKSTIYKGLFYSKNGILN